MEEIKFCNFSSFCLHSNNKIVNLLSRVDAANKDYHKKIEATVLIQTVLYKTLNELKIVWECEVYILEPKISHISNQFHLSMAG